MNPIDEYESQKNMAVRRVPTVELIDRIVAYGRTLEKEVTELTEMIGILFDRVAPENSVWVDSIQALALVIETLAKEDC